MNNISIVIVIGGNNYYSQQINQSIKSAVTGITRGHKFNNIWCTRRQNIPSGCKLLHSYSEVTMLLIYACHISGVLSIQVTCHPG